MGARTLVALLVAAAALAGCGTGSGPAASAGSATLTGQVLAAPSCPVERAESPCPPRPVRGATVEVLRAGDRVATATTDDQGRFVTVVPAGSLLVRATNVGGYRSTAEQRVEAAAGGTVTVRLVVDSGIR
jgi:hypothetical protein